MRLKSLHLGTWTQRFFTATWPHKLFVAGMLLKGLDGILEVAGGLFILVTSLSNLNGLIIRLTHHALAKNPNALIAHYLLNVGQHLSGQTKMWVALYLIGHGVLKLFLVISLLHRKRWAYPVTGVIMLGFMGCQTYVLSQRFSPELLLLTSFDGLVVFLIWSEYRRVRRPAP